MDFSWIKIEQIKVFSALKACGFPRSKLPLLHKTVLTINKTLISHSKKTRLESAVIIFLFSFVNEQFRLVFSKAETFQIKYREIESSRAAESLFAEGVRFKLLNVFCLLFLDELPINPSLKLKSNRKMHCSFWCWWFCKSKRKNGPANPIQRLQLTRCLRIYKTNPKNRWKDEE